MNSKWRFIFNINIVELLIIYVVIDFNGKNIEK
jgi:hypothetical protein